MRRETAHDHVDVRISCLHILHVVPERAGGREVFYINKLRATAAMAKLLLLNHWTEQSCDVAGIRMNNAHNLKSRARHIAQAYYTCSHLLWNGVPDRKGSSIHHHYHHHCCLKLKRLDSLVKVSECPLKRTQQSCMKLLGLICEVGKIDNFLVSFLGLFFFLAKFGSIRST